MSQVTMARSAYGLSAGGADLDWRRRGACRDMDPDMFHIEGGGWSRENGEAAATCVGACPVRVECRDFHLGLPRAPQSTIAGGWRWNAHGQPKPMVAGEGHLVPDTPPAEPEAEAAPRRRGGRPARSAAAGQRFLAAGEALAAGEPIGAVERRFGLARSLVYSARAMVVDCPDLVDDVASGAMSIWAARIELYERRRAER